MEKDEKRCITTVDVMCLSAHDVTVIIFKFKMFYELFHSTSTELQQSAYLSQIL